MDKLRQAVQLALGTDMSNRAIGRELDVAFNCIRRYRNIARIKNFSLEELLALDDDTLNLRFNKLPTRSETKRIPDWNYVHSELQRRHMTLQLLWEEYAKADPETAYRYSQYTHYYREWSKLQGLSMRQQHAPGERGWVDFVGPTVPWVDESTGEVHEAQVFAAALGVSHFLFAIAVPAQTSLWWIECHNQWYAFLGGVPSITVTDNLKAAVIRAGSDPVIHPTYLEMGRHYGSVILPTRSRKPKDKAKAEGAVLIIERWALAPLRNSVFHSIAEINEALRERVNAINDRTMRLYNASRRQRFDEIDRPKLLPLPAAPFAYGEWLAAMKVGIDYHVAIQGHHYSVPYRLVSESVTARLTASVVEIYHGRERVASHLRSTQLGGTTTDVSHQSPAHRAWAQHTPERYRDWATSIGPHALEVIEYQFTTFSHSMLALKACSGLQALAKTYGPTRFEVACGEALRIKSPTRKSIRSLLQNHLEQRGRTAGGAPQAPLPLHHNVRGPDYYTVEENAHAG